MKNEQRDGRSAEPSPNRTKAPDGRRAKLYADVITAVIVTPVLTLISGLIITVVLLFFGWKTGNGAWIPFAVAFPLSLGFCIYAIQHPAPRKPTGTQRTPKRRPARRAGNAGDGGWYPGCPEEKILPSSDRDFDFDGDGHLDAAESSTKYAAFFEDDE